MKFFRAGITTQTTSKTPAMKKITLIALSAITGFGITAFIAPHSNSFGGGFEGVITYSVTNDKPNAPQKNQHKITQVCYLKDGKMRMVTSGGAFVNTVITDCDNLDNPIILFDIQTSKYQLKKDAADKLTAPEIKYLDGTKTIMGYTCHKAEITVYADKEKKNWRVDEVYYSGDILGSSCQEIFKGLKGFPLEWSTLSVNNKPNVNSDMSTAISIEKKSISDDEFKLPPGYKVVTREEMTQDFAKNLKK
jgi:hypothetical protein